MIHHIHFLSIIEYTELQTHKQMYFILNKKKNGLKNVIFMLMFQLWLILYVFSINLYSKDLILNNKRKGY